MNKKLILSMALLTGITHNSYALPYRNFILIGGAVVTSLRAAWHVKKSNYATREQQALDALLGLGQDLGIATKMVGTALNTGTEQIEKGGEFIEKLARETRSDLPETVSLESLLSFSDASQKNKLENTPKDAPVADSEE